MDRSGFSCDHPFQQTLLVGRTDSQMDKRNHIKLLHRDREGWNAWRKEHPEAQPVLQGADLRGLMLRGFNLRDALLDGSDLRDANLRKADLSLASLQEAKLHRAFLSGANLRGAIFTGARMYETVFSDADLSDARGLESCIHLGPSILDHRTLSRSGRLPMVMYEVLCQVPADRP
jgi:hypothetical protein